MALSISLMRALPDDVLELIFHLYRRDLRARVVLRQLRRTMRWYRKCLDSAHPFYTAERKGIILLNTLVSAYHKGFLYRIGPRLHALDQAT